MSVQPASKDPEELPKWLTTRDSDIVSSSSDSGESDDSSTPKKPLLPALQARFLVEVAEREWLISPQGLPVRYYYCFLAQGLVKSMLLLDASCQHVQYNTQFCRASTFTHKHKNTHAHTHTHSHIHTRRHTHLHTGTK